MKTFLCVLAALLLVSTSTQAQFEGTSAMSSAIVTLGAGLVVTGTEEADWGTLAPGTVYTYFPNGIVSPPELANADGTCDPMFWQITTDAGVPGGLVDITILLPSFFEGVDLGGRIPYSAASNSGGAFYEEPSQDVVYQPFDPHVPQTFSLGVDGVYIGLGGILSPGIGVPVEDTYYGYFVLTASYSGF